jgi:serine/threonine protein kinase
VPDEKMQTAAKERTPLPFGPFVLERQIAVGGSADVFLARPRQGLKPAPQLVIKRLSRARGKANDFEVLNREAELHRAVDHPNVVTVFGAGMVGEEPYLAMEYVPGVDLHRLLRLTTSDNRMLMPDVAAYITRSIADALYAVHSAQDRNGKPLRITHGDISPSNIYLSISGEVKLGDFGVAHAARGADEVLRGAQSSEVLRGKLGYLAPEQLKGGAIDQRCDIFALGVVLGEMLIGEKVFSGSGQLATMLSNREANIEPLRRVSDQLPAPIYRACMRALETDPNRRFPDARAFAESLGVPSDSRGAKAALAEWVSWARDSNLFAQKLERRLRHSSGIDWASTDAANDPSPRVLSTVRRAGIVTHAEVSFSALLELAATGHLGVEDEVSLLGAPFRRVDAVPELCCHLMPSTANTTAQLFGPGVPDYTAALRDTPMLDVLARMRNRRESGALFVARARSEGSEERKDIYLDKGRLIHVAASDREDLLGQYMLRLKLISRAELDLGLAQIKSHDGRLGKALVGLGLAESTVVSRAVRNLGRDRVAALCGWREGHAQLYRGSTPSDVEVPLDLDLTIVMMMAAMQALARGEVLRVQTIVPGRRFEDAQAPEERAGVPSSLVDLLELASSGPLTLAGASGALIERGKARERVVSEREAHGALTVAIALEWMRAK